ncbi:hypothetical protein [Brevundimonas sp.]|uniref:hypothetical protein n=1 Tax=Brevundimonas sp. TaxID=1871086 RepID=UPI0011F860C9|nr:hypothetical protein [Brevundimonas sp.]TAJ65244.1 MAG: hypothetical protein EPO49_03360 [Brevundimonas sp.]
MNRRQLILSAAALPLAVPAVSLADAPIRTRWKVRASQGFDALCFLGPLSGKPFYADYYRAELAVILPRMSPAAMAAMATVQAMADEAKFLLGPGLCNILSAGPDDTLDAVITSLRDAERVIAPVARTGENALDDEDWSALMRYRPLVLTVLEGLKDAGFAALRREFLGARLTSRIPALEATLAGYDVIAEQERLLGRPFNDASLEVILLHFSKPHGIKVRGQRFLTHHDYPDAVVLRNAAHEMLHPPFDMEGPTARLVLQTLERDPLLTRVVAEHNPAFGYNSIAGLLNEDCVQALEQIVSERLGFARPPGEYWRRQDEGMHILAAALYGLLKADGYDRTGGNFETWIVQAAATGRLAPASLAGAASRIMELPADRLWTSPAAG